MDWLLRTEFWATFLTLTGLEIVLGIDNIIFHSLTIANLPPQYQGQARIAGMSLAVLMRFLLLAALLWFMSLSKALLVVQGNEISARDLVLLGGGGFLVLKSCLELCKLIAETQRKKNSTIVPTTTTSSVANCIAQIVVLDIVFSLDSVITAVGMVSDLRVIMLAVLVSVAVMMFFSDAVSRFLNTRVRLRTLAFCFIALVGAVLIAEGLGVAVPKTHIYVAGGFALLLEYGISRFASQKREKRQLIVPKFAKFQFFASIPMNVTPPEISGADSASRCVGCQSENNFGYCFCLECGAGLGNVTLELGKVDYPLASG
jgi:predicted tellurium resistance membrane protein TerC